MKYYSIWKDTIRHPNYKALNNDISTDVLIIGGGITGVSTLYHLTKNNVNTVLVEQNKIGFSTTANSTGKLSFLQNDLIDKIRKAIGDKAASLYLKSQIEAISLIKNVIIKEKIDCDLTKVESEVYTVFENEKLKINDFKSFLENNNIEVKEYHHSNKYSIKVKNTYLIHPLKFVYGLLKDEYKIYEKTSISKIQWVKNHYKCYTENHIINAKYVVIASHYPYFLLPYLFPFKSSIEKSYLSASKTLISPLSNITYSKPFVSTRSYHDYLIYLCGSHLINNSVNDDKHFAKLKSILRQNKLNPSYLWSNNDVMTNDGLPYIGKINDNLFIATGYNTWGLTNGFLAGKIVKDLILKKDNAYYELFNPHRKTIFNKTIISNIGNSLQGYINGIINNNKDKNENCYTCPHMGCKLLFNSIEKTWDCPCHGSRFDNAGNCIQAPANRNIKK